MSADYYYDPFGRRLWKDVNGTRTYFFYSDEGLIAEYDASGNEIRAYGYQPNSTWTTDPLFLKQGEEYYWYQNDHLGTPQKLTAVNGTVVWSARYEAFGKADVQVETVGNNLRFPGQYFDAETGLHYNYFRYYDPGIGRYTRVDPIGFVGGDVNLYAYSRNLPIRYADPNGLAGMSIAVWVGGTLGGPVGAVAGGVIGFGIGAGILGPALSDALHETEFAIPFPDTTGPPPSSGALPTLFLPRIVI